MGHFPGGRSRFHLAFEPLPLPPALVCLLLVAPLFESRASCRTPAPPPIRCPCPVSCQSVRRSLSVPQPVMLRLRHCLCHLRTALLAGLHCASGVRLPPCSFPCLLLSLRLFPLGHAMVRTASHMALGTPPVACCGLHFGFRGLRPASLASREVDPVCTALRCLFCAQRWSGRSGALWQLTGLVLLPWPKSLCAWVPPASASASVPVSMSPGSERLECLRGASEQR